MVKIIGIFFVLAALFLRVPFYTHGAKLESPNYTLQLQDVTFEKDIFTEATTDIETVLGKATRGEFETKGSVFFSPYSPASSPFSFSAAKTASVFLSQPGQSSIQEIPLTLSWEPGRTYKLSILQEDLISNFDGSYSIPPTICDDAQKPCTFLKAQKWSENTVGLGYNIYGEAEEDFVDPSFFRIFPVAQRAGKRVAVAHGSFGDQPKKITIREKLIVPKTQPETNYTATIHIVAEAHL